MAGERRCIEASYQQRIRKFDAKGYWLEYVRLLKTSFQSLGLDQSAGRMLLSQNGASLLILRSGNVGNSLV